MQKTKILTPIIIIYIIAIIILFFNKILTPKTYEFTKPIDGSFCEVEAIKITNLETVSLLDDLSNSDFFKLFRVNLDSECPFWTQQLLCEEKSKCFVFRVEESDIPISWKSSETDLINLESSNLKTEKTNSSKEEWFLDDYNQAVYVNLKTNPAGWTGYQGKKIWSIIYEENFFNDHEKTFSDEKIFNNVISGLHASISSHLSEFYFEEGKNKSKPNFRLFFEKVGNHPERISNLYFIYSLLLRAINLAGNHIKNYEIETGNLQNDLKTKEILGTIINKIGDYCNLQINDEKNFPDIAYVESRKKIQSYFYNISKIMDCVDCEKCKVYGKMQITGLGTALNILFSFKEQGVIPQIHRNELIALMNTFWKIAKSLIILDQMHEKRYQSKDALLMTILSCGLVIILFTYTVMRAWEDMDGKLKKKFSLAGNIERNHLKRN